jgi:hypothetical protein
VATENFLKHLVGFDLNAWKKKELGYAPNPQFNSDVGLRPVPVNAIR